MEGLACKGWLGGGGGGGGLMGLCQDLHRSAPCPSLREAGEETERIKGKGGEVSRGAAGVSWKAARNERPTRGRRSLVYRSYSAKPFQYDFPVFSRGEVLLCIASRIRFFVVCGSRLVASKNGRYVLSFKYLKKKMHPFKLK